jgi:RNA polymerase sigma-70 factor (ECF subfamily)
MEFTEIYNSFSPKIYRLCMGYLNDHDKARDLVQETFIAVWQNLGKFNGQSAIGTWIYRIATNTCLRQIEKDKKHPKVELPFHLADASEEPVESKIIFLYKAISELEEADRIIISLVLEGLPQAEIAEITGISEGNLRVKIHRIKQKLTQKFTGYEHI